MDALQALVDWLYKVEPQLAEDQPVHGDLDLVMNLMDAHKVGARSGLCGGQSRWVLHRVHAALLGLSLKEGLKEPVSLLVKRGGSLLCVCVNTLLPGFCISHKEFTKIGWIQICQCVKHHLRLLPLPACISQLSKNEFKFRSPSR